MIALVQSIEHELEVTVQVQKVSSEYERELEEWVLAVWFQFSSLFLQSGISFWNRNWVAQLIA